ncbi:MAG: hypothetical protein ACI8XC_001908 [Gammaproteobacteria bacterium]|jgi:hypothetical protein
MALKHYFHPPAIAAGFVAVLVGYTGSAVISGHGFRDDSVWYWISFLGFNSGDSRDAGIRILAIRSRTALKLKIG